MVKFSILVPAATKNYVKNPALRYDTTNWNTSGSTISRVLTQARFGIASLKVVTNGSVLNEGCFYRVNDLTNVSELITASAYVRGAGNVRLRVIFNPTGKQWISDPIFLRSDRWTRLWATGQAIGSNDVRLYVELAETTAKARTFYVDGAQIERNAYVTSYCDGDQDECRWNGTYHNSTSSRSAYTRAGGRWVQLAGEERLAEDLYMTVAGGLGVAPLKNNIQSFSLEAGGYFQGVKVDPRVMTFTFFAKHVDQNSTNKPVSLAALHQLRQFLIDVVKPDKTGKNEAIWFEYQDGDKPMYFKARYEGGLEGEWDIRNEWINSFPLRLLAVDPLIYEDSQDVYSMDFQDWTNRVAGVAARNNGAWNNMNEGLDNYIEKMRIGDRGKIYAAGQFTAVVAQAAVNPGAPLPRVAYWDGTIWNALGAGVTNGTVIHDIAIAPNGYIYVVGDFTTIAGVAANRVAYWNGSSWNAMGTGLNNEAVGVAVAPNGDVYVGGAFSTAGGVSCAFIARWDGLQWRRVGQYGGLNSNVRSIAISPSGDRLYAGGDFTDQNGFAANAMLRVAQYDTSTGLFSAMGSGFSSGSVYVLKLSATNVLYAGGSFTASGSTTVNRIAQWNGTVWLAMANGLNNDVRDIGEFKNGDLVVVGRFTATGDSLYTMNEITFWNGAQFYNQDINPVSTSLTNILYTVAVDPVTDDYYIGQGGGQWINLVSAGFTTFNNNGSAMAFPVIYAQGPGNLYFIENQAIGKRLYLNMMINNQEEIFIDIAKGTIMSVTRGSVFYTLLPGSDFRGFQLVPGENKIATFMTNDVNAQMQIAFQPRHWSVDATEDEDAL